MIGSSTSRQNNFYRDIRFWIALLFIVRLYGITFPALELAHTWRQADGTMIARNFYEVDSNILYPRVDIAGEKTGIVGSEFPAYNYLIYLIALIFGYEHWYGRLIVLLFSSLGILYFYKTIKSFFDEETAFLSSIVLMTSLWFSYSRKIIPDCFAISLCIISLYYGLKYLKEGGWKNVLIFCAVGLIACAVKLIACINLTVLALLIFKAQVQFHRKVYVCIASSVILVGVVLWYFYWVPKLNATYGFGSHFFMGMEFSQGIIKIVDYWQIVLRRIFIGPFKYVGALVFISSIVAVVFKRDWVKLLTFILPFLLFLMFLFKTGAAIVDDNYYILTLVPALAFIIGAGLSQLKHQWLAYAIVGIIAIESIGDQIRDFRLRYPTSALQNLEAILDNVAEKDELIAVNGEYDNPTFMYFAHRRGWNTPNAMLQDSSALADVISKGCKHFVIAKKIYGEIELNMPISYDSEDFRVYSLKPNKAGTGPGGSINK